MKNIIDYINNNAIVASLITLIISIIVQIIFRRNDRKYEEKKENKKEKKEEFLNKGELHIEDKKWDSKEKPDIEVFMTDFNVDIKDDEVLFNYRKDVLNSKKYKHIRFYLKNIGKSDINQLDICVTSQKKTMLCSIDMIKNIVKNKGINYSYCYDRKILKNDIILLDIAYLEDSLIDNSFSSEIVILFRDSYGNLYEQHLFLAENNIYEPLRITSKEYKSFITTDVAIECFKNPMMW